MVELTELSAADLVQRIRGRSVSATDLMTATLNRIETVNPAINAIISLRPRDELIAEANKVDEMAHEDKGSTRWFQS